MKRNHKRNPYLSYVFCVVLLSMMKIGIFYFLFSFFIHSDLSDNMIQIKILFQSNIFHEIREIFVPQHSVNHRKKRESMKFQSLAYDLAFSFGKIAFHSIRRRSMAINFIAVKEMRISLLCDANHT